MIYCWRCPICHTQKEVSCQIEDRNLLVKCKCGMPMKRDFIAEHSSVRADYNEPIVSDSMAFDSCDLAEHRRRFPNVEVKVEGRIANPVIRSLSQKREYMRKRGFVDQNSFI